MKKWNTYIIAAICGLAGLALIFFPPQRIVKLDDVADAYFEDSVTKATLAYGTTRLINAGVSVVKDSTLQLEPGGVGVAVAIGQVADPLDDMTERLSSVLVTAIVSLLVQKISYEIAQAFVFQLIGIFLILIGLFSVFKHRLSLQYRNLFIKIALFLFVVRFFLPVSAVMSDYLNEKLFFPRIAEYEQALLPYVDEFQGLTEFEMPEIDGIGDIFRGPVQMMGTKSQQLSEAMQTVLKHGLDIFNNLLGIMALYLGIFVIQVLFIPLLMFWLLNKLVFVLFAHQIPYYNLQPKPPSSDNKPNGETAQA